jgi:peptidylprolyl isomerase
MKTVLAEDNLIKRRHLGLFINLVLGLLLISGCAGPAAAKAGDRVKVDYTGKLADGTVFDSSIGKTPLEFTLGDGSMIKGFDKGVVGMKVGETRTLTLDPLDAYGARNDNLVTTVPRSQLPAGLIPVVGQQLQTRRADGSIGVVTVIAINETTMTVDGNSPLAGKTLTFDVKLVGITAK